MTGPVPGVPLGAGREAEVFAWGDDRALRLYRDSVPHERIEQEKRALEAARACGAPAPAVYETITVEGRHGLVMELVDGPDQLTVLEQRPWTVFGAARRLGELHATLHEARSPVELRTLSDLLREHIAAARDLPVALAAGALAELADLPGGDRLCHGDFHPGNVLLSARGAVVIDWTNGARGDPMADVARTLMLLRLGELPPDSSAAFRVLDRVGRRIIVAGYLRAYRRRRSIDEALVARWIPVRAAARLAEGIEGERPALLAIVESRFGGTGG